MTSTDQPTEFDFDANYSVEGYGGIAWWAMRYAQTWEPDMVLMEGPDEDGEIVGWEEPDPNGDGEWVDDRERIVLVMVGDDREFEFEPEELTKINDEDYCHVCGQIGCGHDGIER